MNDQKPKVRVPKGNIDGFRILDLCSDAATEYGWTHEQWITVQDEAVFAPPGEFLPIIQKYFELV